MRDDTPGATLALFRQLADYTRQSQGDRSRRIEATMDAMTFRRLAKDMYDSTQDMQWFLMTQTPITIPAGLKVASSMAIDGIGIFMSGSASDMKIESTPWPVSTFGV